ncbi:hypothetical protein DH96_02315 [Candidatus Phytoplasma oryzae]|uniref:OTU domain-containing protein n=1 Tax=Candidatus Phytoplasma oryzae TaxID=203274 RepID=A0A328IQY7_9MOLU|nr:hypothetical protein [Candidatus Phytoplasma oryzae]RAM57666.1 hypothetical protein DH96_02315 [Candidatus Phytoplasma oryzae]
MCKINKKIKIKKIISFSLLTCILFAIILYIILKNKEKKNYVKKDIYSKYSNNLILDNKSKTKNLIFVQNLAYLGLKQFKEGLLDHNCKKKYQNIIKGDSDTFEKNVLNGTLNTASTSLMQGTIDFLSKKLNRKIYLIINDVHMLSSIYPLNSDDIQNIVNIKLCNKSYNEDNYHFYIQEENDTPGDGYCFFHSLRFALNQEINNWENIIKEDLNFQLKEINT